MRSGFTREPSRSCGQHQSQARELKPIRTENFKNPCTSTTPASFSTASLSTSSPFTLGKRVVRAEEGESGAGGGELSVGHTMGASVMSSGGFWAVPARNDFGQVWSFAAGAPPEMLFTQQQQQPATLFVRHQQQQQQASAEAAMGEASAARVGNYLPGHHLNLPASLSGGNTGSGRREEEDNSR
ncbi:hypothetical protein DY000_02019476 [Brassica cretica]|uniref:TCP domain-containing protein n=1 Tax=Brassica cretica TaxID=69181 RepID=A0ABQ7D846_BRACR|nr:hypothetical protein DY000_02019476 [Brassica cretica]